ncbi:MAG: VOC family protein, partial [Verrucomicrobiaceae bacterium]
MVRYGRKTIVLADGKRVVMACRISELVLGCR